MRSRTFRHTLTAGAALALTAALALAGARIQDRSADVPPGTEITDDRELSLLELDADAGEVLDVSAALPDPDDESPQPQRDEAGDAERSVRPPPSQPEPPSEPETLFSQMAAPALDLGPADAPTIIAAAPAPDRLAGIPVHRPGGMGDVKRGWAGTAGADPGLDRGFDISIRVGGGHCPTAGEPLFPTPDPYWTGTAGN